jgi:hypothetical protein
MEKDGGCCKDEHKFFKNSIDQNTTGAVQLLHAPAIDSHISFINIGDSYSFCYINEYPVLHVPPLKTGTDILIRNCVFRI